MTDDEIIKALENTTALLCSQDKLNETVLQNMGVLLTIVEKLTIDVKRLQSMMGVSNN